jgi:predicted NBD/HSP70 family sugar kinase
LLREINDRSALDLLVQRGSMTRTQLVAATGLSKPTASQLLGRLESAGLVVRTGTTSGGRGPSAQVYEIDGSAGSAIGVDVAPTSIVAAVADLTGRVLATASTEADMSRSADPALDVARVVRQAAKKAKVAVSSVGSLVVASPGVHAPGADVIKHAEHMPAWAAPGVGRALSRRLGLPVTIENDVNVVAVAERTRGAASEVGSFALLWVGAGLGLSIDLGGALHRGFTGGAGEVGYMPLPGFAEPRRGSAAVDFQSLVSEVPVLALARKHGVRARSGSAAVHAALADPARGAGFLRSLADRLATGMAMIVSVLDPEMVVLAGPTSVAGGEVLRDLIETRLRVLSPLRPRIALSAIEGNPVLAGAQVVALRALRDDLFTSTRPRATVASS